MFSPESSPACGLQPLVHQAPIPPEVVATPVKAIRNSLPDPGKYPAQVVGSAGFVGF